MPVYIVRSKKERSLVVAFANSPVELASIIGGLTDAPLTQFQYSEGAPGDLIITERLPDSDALAPVYGTSSDDELLEVSALVATRLIEDADSSDHFIDFDAGAVLAASMALAATTDNTGTH